MTDEQPFDLARLRVTVVEIAGRPVCGLEVGDYFEVSQSSRISMPAGKHFCLYALAAVIPLLPAKMRAFEANDWLAQDSLVACPDPDEFAQDIHRNHPKPRRGFRHQPWASA